MKNTILFIAILIYISTAEAVITVENIARKIQKYHDIEVPDHLSLNDAFTEIDSWLDSGNVSRINLLCDRDYNTTCRTLKEYLYGKGIEFRQIANHASHGNKVRIVYHDIVRKQNKNTRTLGGAVSHNMIGEMQDLKPLAKSIKIQHYNAAAKR